MLANNSKKKTKRLPKGQRIYIRRLKQAARKEASPNSPPFIPVQTVRAPKKQDKS